MAPVIKNQVPMVFKSLAQKHIRKLHFYTPSVNNWLTSDSKLVVFLPDLAIEDFANAKDAKEALRRTSRGFSMSAGMSNVCRT